MNHIWLIRWLAVCIGLLALSVGYAGHICKIKALEARVWELERTVKHLELVANTNMTTLDEMLARGIRPVEAIPLEGETK